MKWKSLVTLGLVWDPSVWCNVHREVAGRCLANPPRPSHLSTRIAIVVDTDAFARCLGVVASSPALVVGDILVKRGCAINNALCATLRLLGE